MKFNLYDQLELGIVLNAISLNKENNKYLKMMYDEFEPSLLNKDDLIEDELNILNSMIDENKKKAILFTSHIMKNIKSKNNFYYIQGIIDFFVDENLITAQTENNLYDYFYDFFISAKLYSNDKFWKSHIQEINKKDVINFNDLKALLFSLDALKIKEEHDFFIENFKKIEGKLVEKLEFFEKYRDYIDDFSYQPLEKEIKKDVKNLFRSVNNTFFYPIMKDLKIGLKDIIESTEELQLLTSRKVATYIFNQVDDFSFLKEGVFQIKNESSLNIYLYLDDMIYKNTKIRIQKNIDIHMMNRYLQESSGDKFDFFVKEFKNSDKKALFNNKKFDLFNIMLSMTNKKKIHLMSELLENLTPDLEIFGERVEELKKIKKSKLHAEAKILLDNFLIYQSLDISDHKVNKKIIKL